MSDGDRWLGFELLCSYCYERIKTRSDILKVTRCALPWRLACSLSAESASCGELMSCVLGRMAHSCHSSSCMPMPIVVRSMFLISWVDSLCTSVTT